MEIFFEGFDGLGETLRFAIDFAKIEISEEFLGTEPRGMEKSGFGSAKIAERDGGNAQEEERVVILGMELQLVFEFHAGLRIGILAAEFENGVTEQAVSAGIFRIELNGFAKFGDSGFRKMGDGIGAADEHVQGGGITHGFLQVLEPFLGVSEALSFEVGKAEKVRGFEIIVQREGGPEIVNGGGKITAVELDAAEDVLGASVTWILADDGLRKLAGFLNVTGAEPSDGSIDSDFGIGRGEFEGFVQFARGFVETGFGDGKIGNLA
jgi:hypothetical protein